jgi:hypothetical protein
MPGLTTRLGAAAVLVAAAIAASLMPAARPHASMYAGASIGMNLVQTAFMMVIK